VAIGGVLQRTHTGLGMRGLRQMNAFEMRENGPTGTAELYIECPVRERVGFKEPKRRSH